MTFRDDDGNELQFNGDFAMTKQAVSFNSGSIKGDVSITFQVDNNSVNREILGYKGPQMTSQVAYVKQPFSRVRNGNILDRGYIVIQSEDSQSLNCFYVSGNSNWMQLFQGLITELDFSGVTNGRNYNARWSKDTVSPTTIPTDGIIFPFIDWCFKGKKGNNYYAATDSAPWLDRNNNPFAPLIQFYPCFYLQSLVNEICSQSEIKKEGNLFSDPIYKSLALTPSNGVISRDPFKKVLVSSSSQTYTAVAGSYEKVTGITLRQSDPAMWDDVLKRFIMPIQVGLFYIHVTMTSGTATAVRIYKNGVNVGISTSVFLGIKKTAVTNSTFVSYPGDYYELYVTKTAGAPYTAAFNVEFELLETIRFRDYINPNTFLPSLKSIDIIRFLINYFGCSSYYDSTSKTLSLTVIEKLKKEDAYDWSDLYVSHNTYYTENAAHNFIKFTQASESGVTNYNKTRTLKFGDGDIQTDNTLLEQKTISQLPFAPSQSILGQNNVYALNIPLINLIDDGEPIEFTSVALQSAGPPVVARFTTGVPSVLRPQEVVRITNGDGTNIGYYSVDTVGGATYEDIIFPFETTDTGKIWRQVIEYQEVEPRIVSVNPSSVPLDFSQTALFDYFGSYQEFTAFPFATFTKSFTSFPIDQWKNNLAIDNPDSGGFADPTIKELYFSKISKFIQNPKIRAVMLLPESVYHRFKFDQFIYLKTENLTGYFFVESIVNYVDGKTPVEVNLFML